MKKVLSVLLLSVLSILSLILTSCSPKQKEIIVGTMTQPGEPILNHIKAEFEQKTGYKLKITTYTGFDLPNPALANGEIDANLFQHYPYLETYNEKNNQNLVKACNMYDCAYGGYTKKNINSIEEIPNGKKVTIAGDASNMARCLKVLESSGLISLNLPNDLTLLSSSNVNDYITSNPKNLVITPMETKYIAESLKDDDVYLGIVNATFAISAGLGSNAKLLCKEEDPNHVNTNILACRQEDLDSDWLKALVEILTSESTDSYIRETFGSTITPYHK